ncbi:hypothetical protein [Caldicellulosiruptor morganii]|uniref:SLH domain-containing protein n=1 Tax=Caldicellulosiruptor morganii TaxID=1387555 RepID=A0ABY7BQT9_9FIRM|nr:hypothetical protein [Caldicellulosiruptor morganii]WAM33804.1 hypothetical protein OTK00_002347 [Caldicellulosiruptor morganii]
MRKLLSFIAIISLLLSFAFPVAHAGTISKTVQAVSNKVQYITAGEFVTSLLMGAKVKPNGIADYWGKAVSMGLIPAEVKKDKPLTRAQASYIVWKLINSVPELKNKNIPVKAEILTPWDLTIRGRGYLYDFLTNLNFVMYWADLLVIDNYYADGTRETKYVWDTLKGYIMRDDFEKFLYDFAKKNPDKLKVAPKTEGGYIKYDPATKSYYYCLPFENGIKNSLLSPDTKYAIDFGGTKWNLAYDLRRNKYLEEYIKNYPRRFALDYTRFAQMADDYTKIPQLYREPMLRLADLGIITPEMSPLFVAKVRFNPAKMLTRSDAVQLITRVFDKSKRDVYDEFVWQLRDYVDMNTGIVYLWDDYKKDYKPRMSIYNKSVYNKLKSGDVPVFSEPKITFRMDKLKLLALIKEIMNDPVEKYYWTKFWNNRIGNSFVVYSFAGLEFYLPYGRLHLIPWEDKGFNIVNFPVGWVTPVVPKAYLAEVKKDFKYYTSNNVKLPPDGIVKRYGDVYMWYVNRFGSMNMAYWCSVNPSNSNFYPNAKIMYAKPDPNIK